MSNVKKMGIDLFHMKCNVFLDLWNKIKTVQSILKFQNKIHLLERGISLNLVTS